MEQYLDKKNIVWQGNASQVFNLHIYVLCALTCFLIIPIFYALWVYLVTKNERYELTETALTLYSGVINKKVEDLDLYRVKDVTLKRPLLLRLFGLGNLYIISSDQTNPHIFLKGISESEKLRQAFRNLVEQARKNRGVRELDVN